MSAAAGNAPMKCSRCGCTDRHACRGGCFWVSTVPPICSVCAPAVRTVRFEDRGQDFLEWDLDADNLVVDARPFQASVWIGCRVDPSTVGVGKRLRYQVAQPGVARFSIKYLIAAVVPAGERRARARV